MRMVTRAGSRLDECVREFVRRGFSANFAEPAEEFASEPVWRRFRELGTELWLDSGNLDEVGEVWTREFSALTTNNTLLNKEIQTGRYDEFILEGVELLNDFGELSDREKLLELAFMLNAKHALRLVERFDAFVSVEEHTDLAHDVERSVEYARRYHAICPERFYVKIPFTAAGLLATRRAQKEGIPINHTLGFSARQNYVIARLAQPRFVNVFLGRLNSFVADNGLGSGDYVGEKATLASQAAIGRLRETTGSATLQIGASFRAWDQFPNLAGIDVITAPPKVAGQLLEVKGRLPEIRSRIDHEYDPGLREDVDPVRFGLNHLWDIDEALAACVDAVEKRDVDGFEPDELADFFRNGGFADFLPDWSDAQIAMSREEGKIPRIENWGDLLADGTIGLDSLMNLAGLNSFVADQNEMDEHILRTWKDAEG